MNFVDKVTIENFWGEHALELDFHDDVNFIIGINGSGKTTVVDMVVAALTANFTELDRLEFSKLIVKLKSKNSRKKPTITITKKPMENVPFSSIEYAISKSATEKPAIYALNDYEEQMMLRNYPRHFIEYSGRFMEREPFHRPGRSVSFALEGLVRISWLSVHRSTSELATHEERFESAVDRRLKHLSHRLVRYFSTLGKQGSEELENFQKTVFLSMLDRKKRDMLFFEAIKKINIAKEKEALRSIFEQFGVPAADFQNRLDEHFKSFERAVEKAQSSEPRLNLSDLYVLTGTERIDTIVEEWHKLLNKRKRIFKPKDVFLEIINSMMKRKRFGINARNELQVTSDTGKELPVDRLSSGEKQLLIVLGEALLQEKGTWIYLADEPELSLHVKWQENLVHNLRAINENSQIIFATHSPDVVSTYCDRVFDMEDVLK